VNLFIEFFHEFRNNWALFFLQDLRQREGCEEYFCKFVEFLKIIYELENKEEIKLFSLKPKYHENNPHKQNHPMGSEERGCDQRREF
jgi:hypothetical protein